MLIGAACIHYPASSIFSLFFIRFCVCLPFLCLAFVIRWSVGWVVIRSWYFLLCEIVFFSIQSTCLPLLPSSSSVGIPIAQHLNEFTRRHTQRHSQNTDTHTLLRARAGFLSHRTLAHASCEMLFRNQKPKQKQKNQTDFGLFSETSNSKQTWLFWCARIAKNEEPKTSRTCRSMSVWMRSFLFLFLCIFVRIASCIWPNMCYGRSSRIFPH